MTVHWICEGISGTAQFGLLDIIFITVIKSQ